MLVLSRKVGQSLVIADGVTVTVSEIGDDFVRLTVVAPNEPEVQARYPQAIAAGDEHAADRPIVVTISLHHATVLDRLRRKMNGDDGAVPSRDEGLAALLDMVAQNDDLILRPIASAPPPRSSSTGKSASANGNAGPAAARVNRPR